MRIIDVKRLIIPDKDAFNRRTGYGLSVHLGNIERLEIAKQEADKEPENIKKIILLVNEFLQQIGFKKIDKPIMETPVNYEIIKSKYSLKHEWDIIWMKFTEDGYLGVVAAGNDINFQIPTTKEDYDVREKKYNFYSKSYEEVWKYNSAGIIVHSLEKVWNESFVLVFPLNGDLMKYNRDKIETGIGNYLLENQVPILDRFSHNYHKKKKEQ